MKIDIMTLISFVAWASIILDVIALILIWRSKELSFVSKMLWVLNIVIVPLGGPVFFFVHLLIERNKEEKKLKTIREQRIKTKSH